jgi:hypothetical protein
VGTGECPIKAAGVHETTPLGSNFEYIAALKRGKSALQCDDAAV